MENQERLRKLYQQYNHDVYDEDQFNAVMNSWKEYQDVINGSDKTKVFQCWRVGESSVNGGETLYHFLMYKATYFCSAKSQGPQPYTDEQDKDKLINKLDQKDTSDALYIRMMKLLDDIYEHRNSPKSMQYVWILQDKAIEALMEAFGVETESSEYWVRSIEVLKKAKDVLGVTSDDIKDIFKLNKFLWWLQDFRSSVLNVNGFTGINLILHGAPGTGKTFTVRHDIEKYLQVNEYPKDCAVEPKYIQFHPSYTYQDFIEGIKPVGIDQNGNLQLAVVNGQFKDFCIEVRKANEAFYKTLSEKEQNMLDPEDPSTYADWPHYFFIVDEINRGNLSSIFGETFTLLEYRDYVFSGTYQKTDTSLVSTPLSIVIAQEANDKNIYKLVNGQPVFGIPFNIHFIGMMNDVDRSIDSFDLALRRRFRWKELSCDYNIIINVLLKNDLGEVEAFVESCRRLNDYLCGTFTSKKKPENSLNLGSTYQLGHAFFLKIRDIVPKGKPIETEHMKELFDEYISGTVKEYIRTVVDTDDEINKLLKQARNLFSKKNKRQRNGRYTQTCHRDQHAVLQIRAFAGASGKALQRSRA
ncbi:MAG: AAA family ATPase [Oscillospiraceae bacterium]|nr:AAA family ATPase [Oscillospiraceae bacterium]